MISEIIPNLSIGTIWDAVHTKNEYGLIICVAEWDNLSNEECNDLMVQNRKVLHAPFMDYSGREIDDKTTFFGYIQNCKVKKPIIESIAKIIHFNRDYNESTLIHCVAGIERSPLAVIYYLWKYYFGKVQSPREVFDFVKSKRPIVEDRLNWLDWEDEK